MTSGRVIGTSTRTRSPSSVASSIILLSSLGMDDGGSCSGVSPIAFWMYETSAVSECLVRSGVATVWPASLRCEGPSG